MKALLNNENKLIAVLDDNNSIHYSNSALDIYHLNKHNIEKKIISIPPQTQEINLFNTYCEVLSNDKKYYYPLKTFNELKNDIQNIKLFFNNDIKVNVLQKRIKTKIEARPYQDKASNELLYYQKGIVYAPTGSGKTNIMCYAVAKNPTKTLIIVPSKELVKQTKERFLNVLSIKEDDIGVINSDVKNKYKEIKPILITTWQSIKGEIKELIKQYNYSSIFVDEAHHSSANVINKTIRDLMTKQTRLYGFSATPYRTQEKDEKEIFELFGNKIIAKIPIDLLYDNNFLVKPKIQIIQDNKNYSLSNIVKDNFISNLLEKKSIENAKYDDFLNSILKIPYFVINDKHLSVLVDIEKLNKNMKISYSDLNKAKDILKLKTTSVNDIKQILIDNESSVFNNDEIKYIKAFQDCYKIYANDFINKNKSMQFFKDFDFSQKIGYLKKSIDEYDSRTEKIFNQITQNILSEQKNSTIILVNTIKLLEKYQNKIQNFIKDNNLNIDFFCLSGSSDKKITSIKNSNNYILLATSDFLREGIDIPNAKKIFCVSPVLPPFAPKYALEQIVGRVIRPFKNKDSAEVYVFDAYTSDFSAKRDEIFNIIQENLKPKEFIKGTGMFNFFKPKEQKIENIFKNTPQDIEQSRLNNSPLAINYFLRDNKTQQYYFYDLNDNRINIDIADVGNIEQFSKIEKSTTCNEDELFFVFDGLKTRATIDELFNPKIGNALYSLNELNSNNSSINLAIAREIAKKKNISLDNELSHFTKNPFLQRALTDKMLISIDIEDIKQFQNHSLSFKIDKTCYLDKDKNRYLYLCDDLNDFFMQTGITQEQFNELANLQYLNLEVARIEKIKSNIQESIFGFIMQELIQNDSRIFNITKNSLFDENINLTDVLNLAKVVVNIHKENDDKIVPFLNSLFSNILETSSDMENNEERVKILSEIFNSLSIIQKKHTYNSFFLAKTYLSKFNNDLFNESLKEYKENTFSSINDIPLIVKNFNIEPIEYKNQKIYKINSDLTTMQENFIFIEHLDDNSKITKTEIMTEKEYVFSRQALNSSPLFYRELNLSEEELDKMINDDRYLKLADVKDKNKKESYVYILDTFDNSSYRFIFNEEQEKITKAQKYDFNIYAKLISDCSLYDIYRIKNFNNKFLLDGKTRLSDLLQTTSLNTNYNIDNLNTFNELIKFFKEFELKKFLDNKFTSQYVMKHIMTNFENINELDKERFVKDIMFQLSRTNNFLGSFNYTTLQHSTNVAKISKFLAEQDGITDKKILKEIELKALFHDAIEVFISDIPTPIKEQNPNLFEIEDKLTSIVYNFLGLKQSDLDKYIHRADKLERQTFINLYMRDENLIEDSLKNFLNKMAFDKVLKNVSDSKEVARIILLDYERYLNNEIALEDTTPLTQKWINSYRLGKDSFGLSQKEIKNLQLNMDLNQDQLKVVKDFCNYLNGSWNLYIDISTLENELYKHNNPKKNIDDIDIVIKEQLKNIKLKFENKDDIVFNVNSVNENKINIGKSNIKL